MRFGRLIKRRDQLFAASCQISSGAVILQRQATDDYVRMRVPDTNCPPLPQPGTPLDSGQADEAEPNRWQVIGSPNTSNKWLVKQNTDQIQLSYACYPGDFELEFEISDLSVLSGNVNGVIFDGIVVELKINDNNWACVGFGFQAANNIRGFGWLRMAGGAQAYAIGPGVLADEVFRARVTRSGSSWTARFWRSGDPNWTNPSSLGNIGSGPVWIRIRGLRFSVGSGYGWWSDRNVQGRVRYLVSNSGAPSSISVTTPVVDVGLPLNAYTTGYPDGITLEWRASNSPFNAGDASPSWSNPVGEYRYWQVRATTTSINTLIERVRLVPDAVPLALWRRFRSYWRLFETGEGRATRGPFRTVFGSGNQQRTGENEWKQTNDEERNVGDGWL